MVSKIKQSIIHQLSSYSTKLPCLPWFLMPHELSEPIMTSSSSTFPPQQPSAAYHYVSPSFLPSLFPEQAFINLWGTQGWPTSWLIDQFSFLEIFLRETHVPLPLIAKSFMIPLNFLPEKCLNVFQHHKSFKPQSCQYGLFLLMSKGTKIKGTI